MSAYSLSARSSTQRDLDSILDRMNAKAELRAHGDDMPFARASGLLCWALECFAAKRKLLMGRVRTTVSCAVASLRLHSLGVWPLTGSEASIKDRVGSQRHEIFGRNYRALPPTLQALRLSLQDSRTNVKPRQTSPPHSGQGRPKSSSPAEAWYRLAPQKQPPAPAYRLPEKRQRPSKSRRLLLPCFPKPKGPAKLRLLRFRCDEDPSRNFVLPFACRRSRSRSHASCGDSQLSERAGSEVGILDSIADRARGSTGQWLRR